VPPCLLLLPLFVGCGGEASPLSWSIRFDDSADRDATAVVATRVIEGGCDGGNTVYSGDINLRTMTGAPQPDELGSGLHGFMVEARGLDCSIIDSVCDEYELPLTDTSIVSVLDGTGGGGGGCPPMQICNGMGGCMPIVGDTGVDTQPPPCEGEGTPCGDGGIGTCRAGGCCFGCWTGTSCEVGSTASACGQSGGDCTVCDPGDTCLSASCSVTSTNPDFSLSPKSVFYRASDGSYWANADDDPSFSQLGPVAAAGDTLRGYTGSLRFADIAAAEVATAGVELGSGGLYTWGTNSAGALGKGSTSFMEVVDEPTRVMTLDTYRAVTAGGSHFCAIRSDGTLWCWGTNTEGQLGVGDTTFRAAPTQVGNRSWITVSALLEHTCAIRDDRTLFCWGRNDDGRVGDDSTVRRNAPAQVGTSADWVGVSAGVGHTCGIRVVGSSGERRLYCWGRTLSGVLGIGDPMGTENIPTPTEVRNDLTGWQMVTTGNFHTCALLDQGSATEAYCWGFGGFGALGTGSLDQANSPAPVDLTPNEGWSTIVAGHDQTCGIASGVEYCWGDSREGWLGIGMSGMMATASSPTAVVFDPMP